LSICSLPSHRVLAWWESGQAGPAKRLQALGGSGEADSQAGCGQNKSIIQHFSSRKAGGNLEEDPAPIGELQGTALSAGVLDLPCLSPHLLLPVSIHYKPILYISIFLSIHYKPILYISIFLSIQRLSTHLTDLNDNTCTATPKEIHFTVSRKLTFPTTLRLLSLFPSQLRKKPTRMEKIFAPEVSETRICSGWIKTFPVNVVLLLGEKKQEGFAPLALGPQFHGAKPRSTSKPALKAWENLLLQPFA